MTADNRRRPDPDDADPLEGTHVLRPAERPRPGMRRVAVIGGGLSGICAARHLIGEGVEPLVFESRHVLGGLWNYSPDPQDGKMYFSLCCNSNKQSMEFPDHPMPDGLPVYPRHGDVLRYLHDYADKHGLSRHTAFRSRVVDASETGDGRWAVTYESLDRLYPRSVAIVDGVVAATGQSARPFVPPVEGAGGFRGKMLHSSQFRGGDSFQGQSVLVVGLGTATGPDIAQEISYSARHVSVSTRRGMTFLPRYTLGVHRWLWFGGCTWWLYVPGLLALIKKVYLQVVSWCHFALAGDLDALGLRTFDPKKDSKDHTAPVCTDSFCFPQRTALGYIKMRPGLQRFTETGAKFTDGSSTDFDTVIFATGYHRELPFTVNGAEFRFPEQPLYKYTFSPSYRGLGFCLYMHSVGSFQVAWMQSRWIVSSLLGKIPLPPQDAMKEQATALSAHQGKAGLDPFDTYEMFASQVGIPRLSAPELLKMMVGNPWAAWRYLMAPRWEPWFPVSAVVPEPAPPAPPCSMTAIQPVAGRGAKHESMGTCGISNIVDCRARIQ